MSNEGEDRIHMEGENEKISYLILIIALSIMGTIGILRRSIPIDSSLLAFFRGIIGGTSILLFALVFKKGELKRPEKKQLILIILSGFAIGINWLFLFEAINYTTVAKATLSAYMEPTIVVFLAAVFLKEKLTVKKTICVAASLFGMVLVSGVLESSESGSDDIKGILFGLGCAAFYAIVVILNKKIKGVGIYLKTIIQLYMAGLIMIPYILFKVDLSTVEISENTFGLILLAGIIYTGVAYVLYFGGMVGLSAQSVSALSYTDPVVAMVCSFFILGEDMSLLGITGAILIIGSAVFGEINIKIFKGVKHGKS